MLTVSTWLWKQPEGRTTYTAEYVVLTQLQADAFVTLDAELAGSVDGIVANAPVDALRAGAD